MSDLLKCQTCGKLVKIIYPSNGRLACCGQEMKTLGNFQSVAEILDFAIEKEEEAKRFYLEWADKLDVPNLKEVFQTFAREEQAHKEKLQRVKAGSTFKPAAKTVTDLKIVDYLVEVTPAPDMDYQEALIVAMRREKASFKFYNDLAGIASDENVRNLFVTLAQEEAKHKLRLETEYEKDIFTEN